jgi:hypothetical protein
LCRLQSKCKRAERSNNERHQRCQTKVAGHWIVSFRDQSDGHILPKYCINLVKMHIYKAYE